MSDPDLAGRLFDQIRMQDAINALRQIAEGRRGTFNVSALLKHIHNLESMLDRSQNGGDK